eukprot:3941403-Rhodomonas_salina.2
MQRSGSAWDVCVGGEYKMVLAHIAGRRRLRAGAAGRRGCLARALRRLAGCVLRCATIMNGERRCEQGYLVQGSNRISAGAPPWVRYLSRSSFHRARRRKECFPEECRGLNSQKQKIEPCHGHGVAFARTHAR